MREPFKSAVIPFSQYERERDDDVKRRKLRRGLVRRRVAQRGHYDQQGTEKTKAKDLRIMGESL